MTSKNKIYTQLLSTADLAMRWQVSKQTIYNRICKGDLMPASIHIGGARRWRIGDVIAWEDSQKEETCVL